MLMPDDAKKGYMWVNGHIVPWADAQTHLIIHGLHYASSVFEGERAYNKKIFKSQEHTARLFQSAKILGMDIPFAPAEIEKTKYMLLDKNNLTDAYIRCFAWRGGEEMGISAPASSINVAIGAWFWPAYFPQELRDNGISLKTSQWRKPAANTAPTQSKAAGLYMTGTLAKEEAMNQGYHEALMLDYRGHVAESSSANLFIVKDRILKTPTPDCFLNGITRQTIMEIAKEKNIPIEVKTILPDELYDADEVFLTGTAAEITAVGKIDEQNYKVGEITKTLRSAYETLVRR